MLVGDEGKPEAENTYSLEARAISRDKRVDGFRSLARVAISRDVKERKVWDDTNGALIRRIRITVSDLSGQIKTASDEDRIKFSMQIKALKGKITELKVPPKKHFLSLPLEARKFAAADYMVQQAAIQDKSVVDKNADVILVDRISGLPTVDWREFCEDSELAQAMMEINDYIAVRVEANPDSLTRPTDILGLIKSDQKKLMIRGDPFEFHTLLAVSRYYFQQKGVRSQRRQKWAERLKNSYIDITKVHEIGQYGLYRLIPNEDDGDIAFNFEGDEMHNCIGWNHYADKMRRRQCVIYSMREREKNGMLKPRVSIEVRDRTVYQFKGPCNSPAPFKYAKYLHEFLVRKLKLVIPEELRRNIGQIAGKYNVFDLPEEGANIDRLELTPGDAPNIDTSRIKKITALHLTGNMTEADICAIARVGVIKNLYVNCREQAASIFAAAKMNIGAINLQYADQNYYRAVLSAYPGNGDVRIRVTNSMHRIVNPEWDITDYLKYLGCHWHRNADGGIVIEGDFTFPGVDQADMVYPDVAIEFGLAHVTGRVYRSRNRKDGVLTMEDIPFSSGGLADGAMPPPGELSFVDYMRKLYGESWWQKNIERDEKGRLCKMKLSEIQIRNLFERIARESKTFNVFNNAELLLSKTAIQLYNNKNPRIWMLGIEAMSLYNQDCELVEQVRKKMFGQSRGRLTRADSKQLARFLMLNHIEREEELIVSVLRRRVNFLSFAKHGVGTGISRQAYKAVCIYYAKKRMSGDPNDSDDEKVIKWLVEIGEFHNICAEFLARAAELLRNKKSLQTKESQNGR